MLDVVVHPGVECLCSLSYVLLLAFIALDKVDYSSALTGHGKIVKWFHRKASFMYFALDEITGVVEFPTSLAKFFEAGFDSLPLWEKLNGKGNKVGLKRSIIFLKQCLHKFGSSCWISG